MIEIAHWREKFKSGGFKLAFHKIWNFLDGILEFLVADTSEDIPEKINRKHKKEQATVFEMNDLTENQKDSLWLSPNNRDFGNVKTAYEILTNLSDGRNFLPTRSSKIVSSFINTYDYIFSSGTFSILIIHIIMTEKFQ